MVALEGVAPSSQVSKTCILSTGRQGHGAPERNRTSTPFGIRLSDVRGYCYATDAWSTQEESNLQNFAFETNTVSCYVMCGWCGNWESNPEINMFKMFAYSIRLFPRSDTENRTLFPCVKNMGPTNRRYRRTEASG